MLALSQVPGDYQYEKTLGMNYWIHFMVYLKKIIVFKWKINSTLNTFD